MFASKAFSYGLGYSDCTGQSGALPRQNCKDLIDLPLCSLFKESDQSSVDPTNTEFIDTESINCVKECSDAEFNNPNPNPDLEAGETENLRGIDYAVHNAHCIRFCPYDGSSPIIENGEEVHTLAGKDACVAKKCHQLSASETPIDGENCNMLPCSYLTTEELIDEIDTENGREGSGKFFDDTKQYCEVDTKCYNFSAEELPYVVYRPNNPMCQIHDCDPNVSDSDLSPECSAGTSDSENITSQGSDYVAAYTEFLDPGFGGASICAPLTCLPIFYRQHRCEPVDDDNPTTPSSSCDSGSACEDGYCTQAIDCNIESNNSEPECNTVAENDTEEPPYVPTADDAVLRSWFYRPSPLGRVDWVRIQNRDNDICYSMSNMEDAGWGERWIIKVNLGFTKVKIDMGYFHYIWDDERSAGHCDATKTGTRGTGYIYTCDIGGNLYSEASPSDGVVYNDGFAKANYELDNPSYSIRTCVRFKNTGRLGACGRRICGIFCEFNNCLSQMCGWDVCKTLTVYEDDPGKCSNARKSSGSCDATIDTYIQLRAAKYGRRLCTFYDMKGTLAYDSDYMDGTEELEDGTCIDGKLVTTEYTQKQVDELNAIAEKFGGEQIPSNGNGASITKCDGKNTNDDEGLAHKWRGLFLAPHVTKDYTDLDGREYKAQECALVPLRIAPNRFYAIANRYNSEYLFAPPLWISGVKEIRGGENSTNGATDFFYPEIEINFGENDSTLLSLSKDSTGHESNKEESSTADLSAMVGDKEYIANIFIRKELNELTGVPTLCLYRTQSDAEGSIVDKKVACVDRNKPDIDGEVAGNTRKAIVTSNSNITYSDAVLNLQLMISDGNNGIDNGCSGDDDCSSVISFDNPGFEEESCDESIEEYKFCAIRDSCTELVNECIANEIDLISMASSNTGYNAAVDKKEICDTSLLITCNARWGIVDHDVITNVSDLLLDMSIEGSVRPASGDENAYGWFNEACIVRGFEDKLTNVVAFRAQNGNIKGKCLVDGSIPGVDVSQCIDGGNANLNCPCFEAGSYDISDLGLDMEIYEIREKTLREAGLCIDIPYPSLCPAIEYDKNINDANDLHYIIDSINQSNINDVHTSHQDRTSDAENIQHAEFGTTFSGTDNFEGSCNGFWKGVTQPSGIYANPTMNCKDDGTWDKNSLLNGCIRYSCLEKSTDGMSKINSDETIGVYSGDYAIGEEGEDQGTINGFANWNSITKADNSDVVENVTSTSCVPGFKPIGSVLNSDETAFTGGTLPDRDCNQQGQWLEVNNPCERVLCPPINPPGSPNNPKNIEDMTQDDFDEWIDSGGATFGQGKASRSSTQIVEEDTEYSVITGTCHDDGINIRFFESSGGARPKRECNHLGQWGEVINPCVTSCDAVSTFTGANDINAGFAYWEEAQDVAVEGFVYGVLDQASGNNNYPGCIENFIYSPYSSPVDEDGNSINETTLFNPGNLPTPPTRRCISIAANEYDNVSTSTRSIWEAAKDPCVDYCPGAVDDPRIGIGKTQHPTSSGTITVDWDRTPLGSTAYIPNENSLDAADFGDGNNSNYLLKRICGTNGLWEDPIPMCSGNSGQIGNAIYSGGNLEVGSSSYLTGTCVAGYENPIGEIVTTHTGTSFWTGNTYTYETTESVDLDAPTRQCVYKNSSNNIDEMFLEVDDDGDCGLITCRIANGDTFGRAYANNDYILYPGDNKTLYCSSSNGDCETNGQNPYVTCDYVGSGNTAVELNLHNDCRDCVTCNWDSEKIYDDPYDEKDCNCSIGYKMKRVNAVQGKGWWDSTENSGPGGIGGSYKCKPGWYYYAKCLDTGQIRLSNFGCD